MHHSLQTPPSPCTWNTSRCAHLHRRKVRQVVGGGWPAWTAHGGHLAANRGWPLVPAPHIRLQHKIMHAELMNFSQARAVRTCAWQAAAALGVVCMPCCTVQPALKLLASVLGVQVHNSAGDALHCAARSHQREVLQAGGRRRHLRRGRLQEALQVGRILCRLRHLQQQRGRRQQRKG